MEFTVFFAAFQFLGFGFGFGLGLGFGFGLGRGRCDKTFADFDGGAVAGDVADQLAGKRRADRGLVRGGEPIVPLANSAKAREKVEFLTSFPCLTKGEGRIVILRRIAERLGRNVTFVRRLPKRYGGGRCVVSPEGGLRYLRLDLGKVDESLLQLTRCLVQPGDVVWDVGANVGLFTVAASSHAGPKGEVLAVEADSWLVGLLRRTASLRDSQRQSPIEVLPCAVSDHESLARFCIAERARSSSHLEGVGTTQSGGLRSTITVLTVRLDWLLDRRPPPSIVKIDVEGAEEFVLSGATRLLREIRPILLVEVGKERCAAATATLSRARYQLFDGEYSRWFERPPQKECSWNTVAIPEECAERICLRAAVNSQ